ncbi:MAG: helix-turn-helix domain-containing protein [Nitrospirae bacterium]|nr:helix-turn-helix domain-containing protein [Nitrospirota bacterium]
MTAHRPDQPPHAFIPAPPTAPGEPPSHSGVRSKREPIPLPVDAAQAELERRLRGTRLRPQADYTTGDVARILGASRETVRQMVLRWEPPGTPGRHPAGLFAYRLGSHRRVPHHALVTWLATNTAYLRDQME